MSPPSTLLAVVALLSTVSAQQPLWGQCGGGSWTGSKTCVSGTACSYINTWYSQCIPSSAQTGSAAGYKYLFSFGDSYSQTGFSISGTKATSSNQLGNPSFPGYTTTGGANWIGYLLSKYSPAGQLLSYNLAYGGATTDSVLIPPYTSSVLSLVDQVSLFSKNLASKPSYAPWTSSNSLFAVWIGVNDVGNIWSRSDLSSFTQTVINRYFSQMQILYNAGAQNFIILTCPPTQRTPMFLASSSSEQSQVGAAVVTYNNILSKALNDFKSKNSGVQAWLYDTATPFNTALNNPSAYGAPNANCYNSDGVSCLWWNNYHPGQRIQELVAKGVASAVGF